MNGESSKKRILFAGGGTGGHLMPAINIAREIIALDGMMEPRFVGKKNGMERRIVESNGFKIDEIDMIGMRRTIGGVLKFAIKWFTGYNRAKRILTDISPVAVVGTGGYISAPVVRAAHKKGIPVFLQEQNSLPGLASRALSKYAILIFTAYKSASRYLDKAKCRTVGNPIRPDIGSADKSDSYRLFDLDPHRKTLLVLGGSSGARGINSAILRLIDRKHIPDHWQVMWQTGKNDYENVKLSIAAKAGNIKIYEFIDNMPAAYAVADLVISRAGAMALSEITALGFASVLIPFPYAAGDHQTMNAKILEESGAAVLIKEKELDKRLEDVMDDLFNNIGRRISMSEQARKLGRPDAARIIAKEILEKINEI